MNGLLNPLAKYRLKTIATGVGLSLRAGLPARSSMSQFCHHLRRFGFEPGTIIDVGVADGTFDLYTAFPEARYLLVEPLAEFEPALRWIATRYDARWELAAAGSVEEPRTIYFGTSLADKHGAAFGHAKPDQVTDPSTKRDVPVRRLDRLVAHHNLIGPYFLKIDTQGTEMDVLKGAEGIMADIEVVVAEVSFFNFRQKPEQPLVDDLIRWMGDRGFFPYDFFGGYNRPLDNALAQIDIAFVKRDGRFRNDWRYDLPDRTPALGHRIVNQVRSWIGV